MSSEGIRTVPKYVHIDMKGGPPTLSYLLSLLPLFKDWGATGIIIEWEDMFPWSGILSALARPGHYTYSMVGELMGALQSNQLKVIPLVQTFGHMEFVLKHDQFKHLREVERFPNSIMPASVNCIGEKVKELITEMVRQVVLAHSNIETIHIGCDEVWCLGQSPATCQYMEDKCSSVTDVFLDHVSFVARAVRQFSPGLGVLVWDDMIRTASVEQLKCSSLDKLVQPVVWCYGQVLIFPTGMLERYQSVWGEKFIWGASAWRGATGSNMKATNIRYHLENHLAWQSVLNEIPDMAGLIMTGWARYDHFATMCELLPVALPSLHCCMALLNHGDWTTEVHKQCSSNLGLDEDIELDPLVCLGGDQVKHPTFPGSRIYNLMLSFCLAETKYNAIMNSSVVATWLNPWQREKGFLNPLQVQVTMHELNSLCAQLNQLSISLRSEIKDTLHEFCAEEWVDTNILPKVREIEKIVSSVGRHVNQ